MAWFTPAQSFAEGWQPGPQLQAAPIHGVLSEILKQRNYERALMQKNIADTIKNVQEQRQRDAYLEAAQKTGVLPEGDYGALGAAGASNLAGQIRQKQAADALEAYRTGMLGIAQQRVGRAGGGRGGGAGGGAGGDGEMVTVTINGVEHQVPLSQVIRHPSLLGGGGRGGGNLITLTDDNNEPLHDADGNEIRVPAGSKTAQDYLRNKFANLNQPLTAGQATSLSKGLGVPAQDIVDSTKHQGLQQVPGAVASPDVGGEGDLLPLSPDQAESEATHVRITPSAGITAGGTPSGPVNVPRPMFERIKQGLMGPGYGPQTQQPVTPPVQPQVSAPLSTGRPDASKGAPVNLPQVGDERPGPNGTTVRWDGRGWLTVQ